MIYLWQLERLVTTSRKRMKNGGTEEAICTIKRQLKGPGYSCTLRMTREFTFTN